MKDKSLDGHYDFKYELTKEDIEKGSIRLDPYFVASRWQFNQEDDTGVLFHVLKTIARYGLKNSIEREIKAMYASIKRMAELNNIELEG